MTLANFADDMISAARFSKMKFHILSGALDAILVIAILALVLTGVI